MQGDAGISHGELYFLCGLFWLTLLGAGIEVFRRLGGVSTLSRQQFRLRMGGSVVMMLLSLLITFGALFVRPQDGRIFGLFWAFCSMVLFGLLLIVRLDLETSRRDLYGHVANLREERRREIEAILHRHSTNSGEAGAADPTSDEEDTPSEVG